ncbi:lipocalin [Litorisediminicola beolgyonensis]|uniref:Lipocalin n=1 Tax=Litorisediminicola beolgyonensis TaxID=1173614 RepID=A0ABW3ZF72_9RHOB
MIPVRDASQPVASQVDADAARLEGNWRVVEGAGVVPGMAVEIGPESFSVAGVAQSLVSEGRGRFRVGGRALWVHWLDADARTAALGDPEGGWWMILDREGRPGERLAAARTILDWYGYQRPGA